MAMLFDLPETEARLAPVADRIETWDRDTNLFPGVDVRLAPGHTPGSSVVVLSDGVARAMLLGDMVHCPLELSDDDFDLLVDVDMELAQRTRVAYARELEGGDIRVAASHFPELRFGRLLRGEGRRRWTFDVS
jgi:glyoxylase-like metal-dependent hydrolase (beta-lactamase superfamily II)